MKILIILSLTALLLQAATEQSRLIDCSEFFEQRKDELMREIEKIDEQQQALQALQAATQTMLDQKEAALAKREQDVNATLQMISDKETSIAEMLEDNKKLLEEVKKAKESRIAETYAKMKASKAAPILEAMDRGEAADILNNLDPKVMGGILAKMTPASASELTELLKKGPPFTTPKKTQEAEFTAPAPETP